MPVSRESRADVSSAALLTTDLRQRINLASYVSALLTMLNSCATGIGVVNIDNGFGAGYLAHIINQTPLQPSAEGDS